METGNLKDIINKSLAYIATYVRLNNKVGRTDESKNSEDFFCEFLNILFDYNLKNLNKYNSSFPGIDIGDKTKKICYQVTAQNGGDKIQETINTFLSKSFYNVFDSLFILIIGEKLEYTRSFQTNGKFFFTKNYNIIDLADLAKEVDNQPYKKLTELYNLLSREIPEFIKDSNRTSITSSDILLSFKAASSHLTNWYSFIDNKKQIHLTRNQVSDLIAWVNVPTIPPNKPIALLSGDAGVGKTVVLKDIYQRLESENVPILGIKADKIYAEDIESLEKLLDFRDVSIVERINILKEEYPFVVVLIDQLDALSQSLSSDRKYLDTYSLLIQKLIDLSGVKVIISIRKFDLDYDPNLRVFKSHKIFELGLMSNEETKDALIRLNIPFQRINHRLFQTIRTPHHLQVFSEIYSTSLSLDGIQELQDLYDELWRQKVVQIKSTTGISTVSCTSLLYGIAISMNKTHQIKVSKRQFELLTSELDYLASCNLIVNDGKELQFFHQTFYDYTYARQFVENGNSIFGYIIENSQTLHIRSSIKMILTYLRIENEDYYIKSLHQLLVNNKIRFHIKLLVINLLGYNQNPSKTEIEFYKKHILKNRKFKRYFTESVYGGKWFEILSATKSYDNLIFLKKNKLDEFFENRKIVNLWPFKLLIQLLKYVPFEERQNENINLFCSVIDRSLPHGRKEVVDYIYSIENFNGIDWVVTRTLSSIKIWDFERSFLLFEKYKENLKLNSFWYCLILEDMLVYNIDLVINEYVSYIFEISNKENDERQFQQTEFKLIDLFEKISNQNPVKAFDCGLIILKHLISSPVFRWYDFIINDNDKEKNNHNLKDIYPVVISITEEFAKTNENIFKDIILKLKNEKSERLLRILLYGFCSNPMPYIRELLDFIIHLNKTKGLGSEGNLQKVLQQLLGKIYPSLNQSQKDIINEIILNISYPYEFEISIQNGKKTHRLEWYGFIKYKYLLALPEDEVINQSKLRLPFLELKRKFPSVSKIEPKHGIMPVVPPMSKNAYEHMSFDQWEESFRKYISNDVFSINGNKQGHAESFGASVKNNPDKYYSLVDKLITDNTVDFEYWIKGLEGLVESNYVPSKLKVLFKKAISIENNGHKMRRLVRMSDFFIQQRSLDDFIIDFLAKQATENSDPNEDRELIDPLTEGINTVRGESIDRLLKCSFNEEYKEKIFSTAEKVAKDEIASVRAVLLVNLAYLIRLDNNRTLNIFLSAMTKDGEKLLSASIFTLQYLVHHDFITLEPYLKKWVDYNSSADSLTEILTWCWIRGYKRSFRLLNRIHRIHPNSRKMSVRIAYENLFDNDINVRTKCNKLFKDFLNDNQKEVIAEYDHMFLHIEKLGYSFEQFMPYLKIYINSNAVKKNPHYFLDYLLKNVSKNPNTSIHFVSKYKSFSKPNRQNGPYYVDEPLKIVLGAYNVLHNGENKKYIEKSIKLFDEMLQTDFLRMESNKALDLVEK